MLEALVLVLHVSRKLQLSLPWHLPSRLVCSQGMPLPSLGSQHLGLEGPAVFLVNSFSLVPTCDPGTMAVLTVCGEWRKQRRAQASIFSSTVDFEQDLKKKHLFRALFFSSVKWRVHLFFLKVFLMMVMGDSNVRT